MRMANSKAGKKICLLLTISIVISIILTPTVLAVPSSPVINATGAIVMDYDTGEVYYEKNADYARPAASMTKVMSAYLTFEEIAAGRLSLDSYVTVSSYAAAISNNAAYSGLEHLKAGGQYTVDTLLRLIFTASCNGSVVVLAENIAGSEAAFVERMNAKAKEMGIDAHYADCCGFIDTGNAVSPRAMAQLARRIIQDYPVVLNYSTLKSTYFQGKTFYSTNTLLRTGAVAGIDGLKTGTTSGAGYCFTGTAKQNGRRIIAVVMNTTSYSNRMSECKKLLEYGFACRTEREKIWVTAADSMEVTISAARDSILPYETTKLTATVSNVNTGMVIPCTASWTINGTPVGNNTPFLVGNQSKTELSWVAEAGMKNATAVCTIQLPNGKCVKGESILPISQDDLSFSGYLGVRRVEMYQEGKITVPCEICCEQGVDFTLPVGWYLDGQPIPNYQNAAFHFAPEARSCITIDGSTLKPGEHILEFRCNTTGLPGIATDALRSEILILTVTEETPAAEEPTETDTLPQTDSKTISVTLLPEWNQVVA